MTDSNNDEFKGWINIDVFAVIIKKPVFNEDFQVLDKDLQIVGSFILIFRETF